MFFNYRSNTFTRFKMLHFYVVIHLWVWYFLIFCYSLLYSSLNICFILFLFIYLVHLFFKNSLLHTHHHGVLWPLVMCIEEQDTKKPMFAQDLLKESFMGAFLLSLERHLKAASTLNIVLSDCWFSQWQSLQSPCWHHLYQLSLGRKKGF